MKPSVTKRKKKKLTKTCTFEMVCKYYKRFCEGKRIILPIM
jgi:hypothetical protein